MNDASFRALLLQAFVLFLLILAGFVSRKLKVLDRDAVRGMNGLILKVSMPAMILHSMSTQAFSPATLAESGQIFLISLAIYGVMALLSIPIAKAFRSSPADEGVIRFVLVFPNVGFMGFPVVGALYGKEALFYTAIFNLPFNLLVFTMGVRMLVHGSPGRSARPAWSQLLSPVIVSILVGFCLFLFQIRLPSSALSAIDLVGSITSPLAMILIGAMLGEGSLRDAFVDWRLYLVSALRLLVLPLGCFVALNAFLRGSTLAAVPALLTAMPAAANTALLAYDEGANEILASRAIFVSTLFSVATIPLVASVMTAMR